MDKIIENIEKGINNGKRKAEANSKLNDGLSCAWISVKTSLPKTGQKVIWFTISNNMTIQEVTGDWIAISTYWMPLPEPPQAT